MAIITTGNNFGATDAVTNTKLNNIANAATFVAGAVDGTSLELISSGDDDGKLGIKDAGVTTAKLATSSSKTTGVTFAKMQHISTAQVLGRLSASEGDVEEVGVVIGGTGDAGVLFDNDDMLDNSNTAGGSATRGATQQSIKAYVDSSNITKTTGTAPYYGCRAFASYNGSTGALNNGANIASVTKNSTGTYTFNFDVNMPDVNYSLVVGGTFSGQTNNAYISAFQTTSKTTSSFQIKTTGSGPSGGLIDQVIVDVAVFR